MENKRQVSGIYCVRDFLFWLRLRKLKQKALIFFATKSNIFYIIIFKIIKGKNENFNSKLLKKFYKVKVIHINFRNKKLGSTNSNKLVMRSDYLKNMFVNEKRRSANYLSKIFSILQPPPLRNNKNLNGQANKQQII